MPSIPPPLPSPREEHLACRLFTALSPRLQPMSPPRPPAVLAPFAEVTVERREGAAPLSGNWFPADGPARGAVLLLHPWVSWGKAYFHHRGRIQALRAAGYHALTLDLAGFGGSGPPSGFACRDVGAGLSFLRRRVGALPLHVWGVSSGGYWAHPVLSCGNGAVAVHGAMFEDVAPHLIEWSWRMVPEWRPAYLLFRTLFPRAFRFLDIRRHAAALRVKAVTYVSGERDPGIRPDETRELARLADGRHHIVAGADHLAGIKIARDDILELALATFERAEARVA
jgi:hypothetical protein